MRVNFYKIIVLVGILICGIAGMGCKSYAYTEEQKQQAKAWLSAHGYSPDAGGAAAAYQDYLDGKFDDELGITRETTADNSDEDGDGNKEEKSTEEKTEEKSTSVTDIYNTMRNEQATEERTTEEITESISTEENVRNVESDDKDENSEEDIQDQGNEDSDTSAEEDITLYDEPAKNNNEEVTIYIILGIVILLIGVGGFALLKDKKSDEKTKDDK